MKIVFIGPFGLQPKATMSVRALPLAKALVARGHAVTMLIPPWDDPDRAGQIWEDEGVQVVNTSLPSGALSRLPPIFHILLIRALVLRTLALQPDVVHCFKPKAYAGLSHLVLWWLRHLTGVSLRLVVDADDWEQAWNEVLPYSAAQKKVFAWQEKWGLRHADAITVASRTVEQLVNSEAQVDQTRVFYVPNGCHSELTSGLSELRFREGRLAFQQMPGVAASYDPSSSRRTDSRDAGPSEFDRGGESELDAGGVAAVRQSLRLGQAPTILLYSRFLEFRLERIITLVQSVATQLPQARWLIVGRGLQGEEKILEAKLRQVGLGQYVRFTGWLPAEQLPTYFQVADVAIYPYDDTLINRTKCSVKLIDLLTAGLPVVADAVGQNREYIKHNQSGLLVPAEDDVAFGQALVALLQENETRQHLGQAAAHYLRKEFAWSNLSQIVERAYSR